MNVEPLNPGITISPNEDVLLSVSDSKFLSRIDIGQSPHDIGMKHTGMGAVGFICHLPSRTISCKFVNIISISNKFVVSYFYLPPSNMHILLN
ncbi:MAG: hypothetical protein KKA75_00360 [Proteobacteria bacterium]|nr:hypothetical protein [Pseudomonadota bacterium]